MSNIMASWKYLTYLLMELVDIRVLIAFMKDRLQTASHMAMEG